MSQRIEVGVLGATGMVGQQFIAQLAAHPWFTLTWVGASERSAGQKYRDAASWKLPVPPPADLADLVVQEARPGNGAPELVFSAMDASVAGGMEEEAFARAGHIVVSNSRNHRMAPDVPLLVPEINSEHLGLLKGRCGTRLEGGDHHQPELLDGVPGRMALAPLRQFGLIGARDHAAGAVRRWLPGRRVARRRWQRDPLHLGRGSQDRDRDTEDPRLAPPRPHRAASGRAERLDHAGGGRQRPHRVDCRAARSASLARRGPARAGLSSLARPSGTSCRARPASPSCTCTKRTARSHVSTWTATAA